jgi:hypothetical protein
MSIFSHVLEPRSGKPLPIVPFAEWNAVVAKAAAAAGTTDESFKRFPSTKIQNTFDGMMGADEGLRRGDGIVDEEVEAGGMARMSTKKAEGLSESLRSTETLGEEHIGKWVAYWEKRGLFI